jgi:hypothetical protein
MRQMLALLEQKEDHTVDMWNRLVQGRVRLHSFHETHVQSYKML